MPLSHLRKQNATYVFHVTPTGEGGISIIWLIGPNSHQIISCFFKSTHASFKKFSPHRLYFGHFYDKKILLDEVIINCIPAKDSFSGLETIEINSHGGMMPVREIIDCLLKQGSREINQKKLMELASENKRLDPIREESLTALLNSPTTLASQVFLDQFNGALSMALKKQDVHTLNQLLTSAKFGLSLNHPKRILIIGKPNTGKSTLFNALTGKERMITHPTPGTTRDVVEEIFSIQGIPFSLMDTAGWRTIDEINKPQALIEKIGIKKMKAEVKKADIIICLLDGSEKLTTTDKEIIPQLKRLNTIWVVNKYDLPKKLDTSLLPKRFLFVSALKQKGIEKLRETILLYANIGIMVYRSSQPVIFTRRQYELVKKINNESDRSRQN